MQLDTIKRQGLNITDFQFLKAFKHEGENIHFRLFNEVNDKSATNLECLLLNTEDEYLTHKKLFNNYQKRNFGIYFVVNNGGTKKVDINEIVSHMLDMDFGKVPEIKNGKVVKVDNKIVYEYRTQEEIEDFKKDFLNRLKDFKLEPSIIVETKNGFHVYWLMDRKAKYDISLYEPLQTKLINFFGKMEVRIEHADIKVKTKERVMRIVGYKHLKDPLNPFIIKCIHFKPEVKYIQQDFINLLGYKQPVKNSSNNIVNKKNKIEKNPITIDISKDKKT